MLSWVSKCPLPIEEQEHPLWPSWRCKETETAWRGGPCTNMLDPWKQTEGTVCVEVGSRHGSTTWGRWSGACILKCVVLRGCSWLYLSLVHGYSHTYICSIEFTKWCCNICPLHYIMLEHHDECNGLRSCICVSEFCNRNITKVVAKINLGLCWLYSKKWSAKVKM